MKEYLNHIREVAQYCADRFGDDFYAALNVAECIVRNTSDPLGDAQRVHAVLEGEL